MSTTSNRIFKIKTSFTGADINQNMKITLAPKSNQNKQFYIVIPGKATRNGKRTSIVFSRKQPEGTRADFFNFLKTQLSNEVGKWKKLEDMREWVARKDTWRMKARTDWLAKFNRATRLRSREKQPIPPPAVAQPKKKETVTIPLTNFLIKGMRAALSVYPRAERTVNKRVLKPHVMIWIPRCLGKKELSMGTKHGISESWMQFVVEYLQYAASKWKTPRQCKKWINNYFVHFREFVDILFSLGGFAKPTARRKWRIGKSQIAPCLSAFDPGKRVSDETLKDTGFGVFCTVSGRINFDWHFPDPKISVLVDKRKEWLTDLQKTYQADGNREDPDGFTVWVPTREALNAGAIPVCYLLNHCEDDDNPTHKLRFDTQGNTYLKCIRDVEVNEEYKFNYNLSKSKDDTAVQQRARNRNKSPARKKRRLK